MKSFTYQAPVTLNVACQMLVENEGSRILAGGTDLLVKMKRGSLAINLVVDIKKIPELYGITSKPGGMIFIGALTALADLARSEVIREKLPVLATTATNMASMQVRNRATIGGNLCNAAPSADLAPSLIALHAQVVIVGPEGERQIPLATLFKGPGITILAQGDILTGLLVPLPHPDKRFIYLKHKIRQAMDIAIVGVAVGLLRKDQICQEADIVLGSVAPVPLQAPMASRQLLEGGLTAENIERAADIAAAEATPISDVRATAGYRQEIIKVLVKRAIYETAEITERKG
ncbi:MAG: hypothetical protein APF81_18035 [Desulfosporosinus sp. BRH_c37]|nr:MAG: hypothetical protein APF81_18035 [Desulfosporosinus sp. BRH_c37]